MVVRDGVIAGFYHPYLGVEGLVELLNGLEKIPGIEWIELKQMDNTVKAEHVEITTEEGEVNGTNDYVGLYTSSLVYPLYHLRIFTKNITWVMAGAGGFAVILFTFYIIFPRGKQAKHKKSETRSVWQQNKISYPTVSILNPAHNEKVVIGNTLEALSNLDYPNYLLEVIVINDNSSDRTGEIAASYARNFFI